MPTLHVRCPHCHKTGKLRDPVPGRRIKCACGKAIQLPRPTRLWLIGPAVGLALACLFAWLWLGSAADARAVRDNIESANVKHAEIEKRIGNIKKRLASEAEASRPVNEKLKDA